MDIALALKRHKRWRIARVFMYAGLTLAGVSAMIFPSNLVEGRVGSVIVYVWSFFMFVSACGCLLGSWRDSWFGEYVFLPMLFSVLFLYGFSAMVAANLDKAPLLAYGLVVVSFGSGLFARWQDVRDIKIASKPEVAH